MPVSAKPKKLSIREIEILRHLVTTSSYVEIAGLLKIGHETVRTHIRRIGQKLGISTKVRLALWAERNLGAYHVDTTKK